MSGNKEKEQGVPAYKSVVIEEQAECEEAAANEAMEAETVGEMNPYKIGRAHV